MLILTTAPETATLPFINIHLGHSSAVVRSPRPTSLARNLYMPRNVGYRFPCSKHFELLHQLVDYYSLCNFFHGVSSACWIDNPLKYVHSTRFSYDDRTTNKNNGKEIIVCSWIYIILTFFSGLFALIFIRIFYVCIFDQSDVDGMPQKDW